MVSKKSLEILKALFSKESNVSLPIGLTDQVLEIRQWAEEQLALPENQ